MVKNGTIVDRRTIVNKDLYKRYIVLYNQADPRQYFPQERTECEIGNNVRRAKLRRLKEKLWTNPLWRGFIKFLQKTGIMKIIDKLKIKQFMKKTCGI